MGKAAISIITGSTKLEILPSWNIYNLHSQVQSLGQRCWTSWLWCAFCRMVVWFVVEVWVGENTEKVKVDFFTPFYVKSGSIFIGPEIDHWECLSLTHWLTQRLTHWLLFSELDWRDPGMWRWQFKTCWGCYCCSCWWCETCWQQFHADLKGEFWS